MVKTTGVWTEKEYVEIDYTETISGDATAPTAVTDSTDENRYGNGAALEATPQTITLNIYNNNVDTASGYAII